MATFFSSDMHFFHENVIKYCDRPFENLQAMHEAFIYRWNSKVTDADTAYLLGDISFGSYLQTYPLLARLNGRKILILGNHDASKESHYRRSGLFARVENYLEKEIEGVNVALFHFPILEWHGIRRGTIHLHGHLHSRTPTQHSNGKPCLDVGVDAWGYYPVSMQEVIGTLPAV